MCQRNGFGVLVIKAESQVIKMGTPKNIVTQIVTVLAFVHIASANALLPPNWERPLIEANLHEFDISGREVSFEWAKILTLNGRKSGGHPCSFLFCEEKKEKEDVAQSCRRFWVISPKKLDGCGGEIYLAAEDGKWNSSLLLKDQRFRICDDSDYRDDWVQDLWEITLTDSMGRQRIFRGEPVLLEAVP